MSLSRTLFKLQRDELISVENRPRKRYESYLEFFLWFINRRKHSSPAMRTSIRVERERPEVKDHVQSSTNRFRLRRVILQYVILNYVPDPQTTAHAQLYCSYWKLGHGQQIHSGDGDNERLRHAKHRRPHARNVRGMARKQFFLLTVWPRAKLQVEC